MKIKLPSITNPQNSGQLEKIPLGLLFSPSEIYHENSKLHASDIPLYSWISFINSSVTIRKTISRPITHMRGRPIVSLSRKHSPTSSPFEEIIKRRRSIREFSGKSISLEKLSKILFLGDAVVTRWNTSDAATWSLRTSPSPGGLYPLDIYCISLRVSNLEKGLYFYNPSDHQLETICKADMTGPLIDAVSELENALRRSCVCIILGAIMPRVKFKYGERGYRFALLEAGHIAQNLLLTAEAEELGAFPVGGFEDDKINRLIHFDGLNDIALYLIVIGSLK